MEKYDGSRCSHKARSDLVRRRATLPRTLFPVADWVVEADIKAVGSIALSDAVEEAKICALAQLDVVLAPSGLAGIVGQEALYSKGRPIIKATMASTDLYRQYDQDGEPLGHRRLSLGTDASPTFHRAGRASPFVTALQPAYLLTL